MGCFLPIRNKWTRGLLVSEKEINALQLLTVTRLQGKGERKRGSLQAPGVYVRTIPHSTQTLMPACSGPTSGLLAGSGALPTGSTGRA